MRIILLACCAWLARADTVPQKCDGVTFNGKYYDKEALLNITSVGGLFYDKFTNTLFFEYIDPENKYSRHTTSMTYYNIDSKDIKDIPTVNGAWTAGVDSETGDVYLGCRDGIYKFNYQNKTAVPYTAEGVVVLYLYYSKVLYYTSFPEFKIHSYDGKETKIVYDKAFFRFIENEEKYFFVNSSGLYRVLDDDIENAELFSDPLYRFAKDNNGNIFMIGHNAVHVPNEEKKKLDKIADIEGIRDLVFDKNNNIIYSDQNSIYRLTPCKSELPASSISI